MSLALCSPLRPAQPSPPHLIQDFTSVVLSLPKTTVFSLTGPSPLASKHTLLPTTLRPAHHTCRPLQLAPFSSSLLHHYLYKALIILTTSTVQLSFPPPSSSCGPHSPRTFSTTYISSKPVVNWLFSSYPISFSRYPAHIFL